MNKNAVINEIVKRICGMIDDGNVDGSEELNSGAQGFEKIKSKAENVQRLRDADDETYRTYIWSLLNGLLASREAGKRVVQILQSRP